MANMLTMPSLTCPLGGAKLNQTRPLGENSDRKCAIAEPMKRTLPGAQSLRTSAHAVLCCTDHPCVSMQTPSGKSGIHLLTQLG